MWQDEIQDKKAWVQKLLEGDSDFHQPVDVIRVEEKKTDLSEEKNTGARGGFVVFLSENKKEIKYYIKKFESDNWDSGVSDFLFQRMKKT